MGEDKGNDRQSDGERVMATWLDAIGHLLFGFGGIVLAAAVMRGRITISIGCASATPQQRSTDKQAN
jgi:hypothetical protein